VVLVAGATGLGCGFTGELLELDDGKGDGDGEGDEGEDPPKRLPKLNAGLSFRVGERRVRCIL